MTGQGIGEYWEAKFDEGKAKKITSVKIWTRKDQCGDRLANSLIRISGQKFGYLPEETKTGEMYEVKPEKEISGTSIRVETTWDSQITIACIKVFGEDDLEYDYEAGIEREAKIYKKEKKLKKNRAKAKAEANENHNDSSNSDAIEPDNLTTRFKEMG
jgi:hypothetical protein